MLIIKNLFVPTLLSLFLMSPVYSDLVVEASVVTTTSNNIADVIFTARDDDGAANGVAELSGYNIPLDIGGDGLGVPDPISFSSVTPGASFGTPSYVTSPGVAPFNWDAGVAFNFSDSTTVTLTETPIELFTLQFSVDSSAVAGNIFDILIVNPALPNPATLDFSGPNLGDFVNNPDALISGQIQIAAIPEPNALALIFGFASLAGMMRRRV